MPLFILTVAVLLTLILLGESMLLVGCIAALSPAYPRRWTLSVALLGLLIFIAAARALALAAS